MFAKRYFPGRRFPGRYFPPVVDGELTPAPSVPIYQPPPNRWKQRREDDELMAFILGSEEPQCTRN